MSTERGSYAASVASSGAAAWIALSPSQDRALWARWPGTVVSTRRVPWQPASITPSVGSSRIARSPASQSGWCSARRRRPLRGGLDLFVVVARRRSDRWSGSATVAARCSMRGHAGLHVRGAAAVEPAAIRRDGTLPAIGTVSRWPARMTRRARPSSVNATTASPSRSTCRCGSRRERLPRRRRRADPRRR